MRSLLAAALSAALALLPTSARADLRVAATTPDLAAISKAVGGKTVQVTALSLPTQDPHFVDAKPSLVLELNRADLLVRAGLGLEQGWLPTLVNGARNARIRPGGPGFFDASTSVNVLEVPEHPVDRSQGDVHPEGNPHFLYDPRRAEQVARALAARMAELDPKNAQAYQANAQRFVSELEAARSGWEKRLAPLRGKPVVAFHKTTPYLAEWLGLDVVAFLEPKPGIPPNPSHVVKVLGTARARHVVAVLREEYYPDPSAQLVAEKIPARLVVLPGGTDVRAGETYLQNMEQVVKDLEEATRGR